MSEMRLHSSLKAFWPSVHAGLSRQQALKIVPRHTMNRSLQTSSYKFRLGGTWCYARSGHKPEAGFHFKLGKPVILTFQDGSERSFASLPYAREKLGVKRGIIESCISRKTTGKIINTDQQMSFTARFA